MGFTVLTISSMDNVKGRKDVVDAPKVHEEICYIMAGSNTIISFNNISCGSIQYRFSGNSCSEFAIQELLGIRKSFFIQC